MYARRKDLETVTADKFERFKLDIDTTSTLLDSYKIFFNQNSPCILLYATMLSILLIFLVFYINETS